MKHRWVILAVLSLSGCFDGTNDHAEPGSQVAVLSEEVRIDGYAEDLVPIGDVRIGPGGQIVVAQPQERRVRFYDESGSPQGSFGRPGEGPGEFAALSGIGYVADTLWMWDGSLRRMTLVSPEFEIVRTFFLSSSLQDTPAELTGMVSLYPRGIGTDGDLIVQFSPIAGILLPEPYTDHSVFGRATSEGQFKSVVAQIKEGGPSSISTGTGGMFIPVPLANPAYMAVSHDATEIVGATTSLSGNQADSISVVRWNREGEQVWTRSIAFDPVPLPQSVVDSVLAPLAQLPPRFVEAFEREFRAPASYPPLTDIHVGRDGTVWVGLREDGEGKPYEVLSLNGERIGRAILPHRSRVRVAELNRLWAVERDEFDVESELAPKKWTPS